MCFLTFVGAVTTLGLEVFLRIPGKGFCTSCGNVMFVIISPTDSSSCVRDDGGGGGGALKDGRGFFLFLGAAREAILDLDLYQVYK